MKLTKTYPEAEAEDNLPFEGDLTLWLKALPSGANIREATVTIAPAQGLNAVQFQETFTFSAPPPHKGELSAADWGIQRIPYREDADFVEVDFHTPRTLAAVVTSSLDSGEANLLVDMGGVFLAIAADGSLKAPDGKFWTVKLANPDDTESLPSPLPGLKVSKFSLTTKPAATTAFQIQKVTIRSVPTNVSVRLGQMPPFWTRSGELATTVTSPNFAEILNSFLADAALENGYYAIPFVIHSDAIARLEITLDIDYVIIQPALPAHLPEIQMKFGFSGVSDIDPSLLKVTLPRGAIPIVGQTQATVRGEFEPTRIAFKQICPTSTRKPVPISPDCSLAQQFLIDREIPVTAVDLVLTSTDRGLVTLNLSIQEDADGRPSGIVLIGADFSLEMPLPDPSQWSSVPLAKPLYLEKDKRYWLILQSKTGTASWYASPTAPQDSVLYCSRNDGFSWSPAKTLESPTPSALFRLRHKPDRFSVPIWLQIGEGANAVCRLLEEFSPLGRVEFNFDFAEKLQEYLELEEATPVLLTFLAEAPGELTVSDLYIAYDRG